MNEERPFHIPRPPEFWEDMLRWAKQNAEMKKQKLLQREKEILGLRNQ